MTYTHINTQDLISCVATKIARTLAKKESKKTKKSETSLFALFFGQVQRGISTSSHFIQRVQQRFEANQSEELSGAIARAIRNTQVIERGGMHITQSQKFFDTATNIVVVLEKRGVSGAALVTAYRSGEENLISDDEYQELVSRGIL
ncbi:hypothetical protein LS66_007530 [Helicobacter sp. MIT 03-1614]|jgi:hypothetical protein|uniref:Uncharacterized protein n=1 Tax=Helicobacter hepaticus (strain ATCC 51449 / 3B1) TaxID=235279 RepID=Q7VJF8_HELHP|nr:MULTISPECIES: hypothetical protein [Helicobacter]AAP76882.1 hypothetical protein HH_0285 [Helicobacter hepaticus ATCC 51449]TLD87736.1 hypothetical protein LS66_007530 [Helicobacter sp. MIT 03-1614]